jgi:hypothetical protein
LHPIPRDDVRLERKHDTMTKSLLSLAAFTLALAVPEIALAQQPSSANCPPGSWFCADTQTQPAAPAGQPVQPTNPGQPSEAQHPSVVYQSPPPPPPVVVYQPPPPVVVHPEAPPPYYYHPREGWPRRNEWGLNGHIEGAMIGGGVNGNAGMGGLGFGLRYKPMPQFGIEADLDFIGGRDYNDMKRDETAFTINGLIFLNPRSRAQVYLLGGFGWSGARVQDDRGVTLQQNGYYQSETHYGYFGGQAGIGLELRLSRHFALNADIRGFIRGRIDNNAQYTQEFHNADGRSTNTSGGGLLTGGATIYF